jgi:hypothetical protein
MAAADEVNRLADRTLPDLDAAYDLFHHTEVVWDEFRLRVQAGYAITDTHAATRTTVTQDDLVRLAPTYARNHWAPFTLGRFVAIFELFLFDLLRVLLLLHPARLSNKNVDFATVLATPDRDAIIQAVVDRELNEVKYRRVRDWFVYLESAIHIGCPAAEEIERLAELKASRDVLEHNAGVANAVYLSKAGSRARYQLGDRIEVPDAYLREGWLLLRKVAMDVAAAVTGRLATP